jgi:hypothetical protein
MSVQFIQYMLPNGTKKPVWIDLPDEVEAKAALIRQAGFVFEIEVLRNGMVSATIGDPVHELDCAFAIVNNGLQVPKAIEDMIMKFDLEKPYV